jgi:probable rRNA maturation factor
MQVDLYLTKSPEIKALNKRYRGKNKATDVLSFPSGQNGLLGSIIIDVQTAKKQAKFYKHSVRRELQELFVHGVLHLLGHDHEKPEDAAKMKKQEEKFNKTL